VTPRIAVAVVSWNTRELLRACLHSLEGDAKQGLAAVWVVDNASDDGSAEMVVSDFPWASLISSRRNLGFGAAVNLVADRARAPWIAPSNADVELAPGALSALLGASESDDRVGAIAPRLIMPDGSTQHSVHPFPTVGLGLMFNSGLARFAPGYAERLCLEGYWDPDDRRQVDWAHGAFLLVRREAFAEVGGFDRDQWMYAEDLDLGWRLRRAGWKTVYEPTAIVHHEVAAAARQAFAEGRQARHLEAAYEWMARRQGLVATRAYALLNIAGAAARWLALSAPAAVHPGRFAAARDRERRYLALHRLGLRARPRGCEPKRRLSTLR
jgi:N-acetylglucosaminyl-diphospho-decaprenol L-rhamnosyltransferase